MNGKYIYNLLIIKITIFHNILCYFRKMIYICGKLKTMVDKIKIKKKRYLVLYPHLLGLDPDKEKRYIFRQTYNGYVLYLAKGIYIGYPNIIIERNTDLFKLIEDESKT